MRTGIYTRISEDDGGRLGVARQEEDARLEAHDRGWVVVEAYVDNDVSATRSKERPEFNRMLDDVRRGHIQSVIIYDADRLTRSPREAEDLIDLADSHGLEIISLGAYRDLSTPAGRRDFRNDVTNARFETDKMSRRIKRKNDQRAAEGRPHGPVGYGFQRVDGHDIAKPDEAANIREATRRVLAGESLRSIVKSFTERRIASPGLGRWTTATLRQTLMRPSLAGLRKHRGVIIGKTNGDSIITEDEHARLVALFTDPTRRNSPGTGRAPKHLLSGLARCGRCGETLGGRMRRIVPWTPPPGSKSKAQPAAYACDTCHRVRRKQEPVDELVTEVVLRRLERSDAADLLISPGNPTAASEARDTIAGIDARLATAADQFAEGAIDGDQLKRITATLRAKRAEGEAALQAALPPAFPLDAVGPRARDVWAGLDIDRRRAVIDALAEIVIMPGGVGKRGFDPTLVQINWKSVR